MNDQVKDFIRDNKISVMSVLQLDNSLHSAAVHYSCNKNFTEFYIATNRSSRKATPLLNGKTVAASMVIGFNESEMITLQMSGELRAIKDTETLQVVQSIHYAMHPFAKKFENNPETIFLVFTPSWWRFSMFKEQPPVFIES